MSVDKEIVYRTMMRFYDRGIDVFENIDSTNIDGICEITMNKGFINSLKKELNKDDIYIKNIMHQLVLNDISSMIK